MKPVLSSIALDDVLGDTERGGDFSGKVILCTGVYIYRKYWSFSGWLCAFRCWIVLSFRTVHVYRVPEFRKQLVQLLIQHCPSTFLLYICLRLAALDDILGDMGGDGSGGSLRMFRLLQGDVGSGKTAVAFLAMLKAAEQGSQSCMLAPTEVLTMQHLQTLRSMVSGIERLDGRGGLRVEVLTGGVKGKARQMLLEAVGAGEVRGEGGGSERGGWCSGWRSCRCCKKCGGRCIGACGSVNGYIRG